MHDDGRDDKPSASRMPRIRRCPGSWAAELAARGNVVELTADADEGTARHSMIEAGFDADSIDDKNAAYTVSRAATLFGEAAEKAGGAGATPDADITEVRLWVHDDALQPVVSARLDRLVIWGRTALIADYKTLFGDHGHAANSEQLATQVVAVAENYDVDTIYAAYIQPNLPKERQLTMAVYSRADVAATRRELMCWLDAARSPHADRIPGEHCTNCLARANCKEAVASAFALAVKTGVELMEPQVLGAMLDRCKMAEAVIEAVRAEAKKRLEAKVEIPGWALKDGAEQFKITSPAGAFAIAAAAGVTNDEFIGAVDVKIGALVKLYTAKREDVTKKKAEEELRAALVAQGFASVSQNKPSLSKLK